LPIPCHPKSIRPPGTCPPCPHRWRNRTSIHLAFCQAADPFPEASTPNRLTRLCEVIALRSPTCRTQVSLALRTRSSGRSLDHLVTPDNATVRYSRVCTLADSTVFVLGRSCRLMPLRRRSGKSATRSLEWPIANGSNGERSISVPSYRTPPASKCSGRHRGKT
jgi:hypothetical protein